MCYKEPVRSYAWPLPILPHLLKPDVPDFFFSIWILPKGVHTILMWSWADTVYLCILQHARVFKLMTGAHWPWYVLAKIVFPEQERTEVFVAMKEAAAMGDRQQHLKGCHSLWCHMHEHSVCVITLTARGGKQKLCSLSSDWGTHTYTQHKCCIANELRHFWKCTYFWINSAHLLLHMSSY